MTNYTLCCYAARKNPVWDAAEKCFALLEPSRTQRQGARPANSWVDYIVTLHGLCHTCFFFFFFFFYLFCLFLEEQ